MTSKANIEQLDKINQDFFNQQLCRLEKFLKTLPDKPEETPFSALCSLWQYSLGKPLSCRSATEVVLQNLAADKFNLLAELVEKRIIGTPIAYLVGRQNFMGLELFSNCSALIPRKETEQLAEVVVNYMKLKTQSNARVKIIDHFTGSGNLPLCFANAYPQAEVYGADLSEQAIELAKKNAQYLNLKVKFAVGDMFEPFASNEFYHSFDIVSGAPPYIIAKNVANMDDEISKHEPKLAFEAGPFGFTFFMRLMDESPKFLKKGGWLAFEVGLGQGEGISRRLKKNKAYDKIEVFEDKQGNIRVVAARTC